ncbi:3-phosphoglycerate kinase [Pseudomonas sp. FEN]|uniref:3-phosphoglycerate kinase n=1 Tax=Pseudomonas sp. FEN TaxID=2767468 RepID=UPI00174DF8FC|nr:3-phosphoglycerate kinase [Pseudomonas sp. FEN]CAD5200370.1 3-phosphoglycerate kinase [Pseudomonas sp. FEN]
MRKICCVLLVMLPLTAWAYPIEVEKHLNGLSIDYTAFDTDTDIGAIQVNNYGKTDALCTVVFRNGPESPRTRKLEVAAGKSKNASAKFTRSIIRLRLELTCTAK